MASLPQSINETGGMLLFAALEDAHAAAKQQIQETNATVQTLKTALTDAEQLSQSLTSAAEQLKTDEENTEAASIEANKAHKVAESDYSDFKDSKESELAMYAERREQLQESKDVLEKPFSKLAEGTTETEKERNRAVEAVIDFLSQLPGGKDKALVAAAPVALNAAAATRHEFDSNTINVIKTHLNNAVEERQKTVQASAESEAMTKAELLGLWAITDCTKDALASAKAAAADAKASRKRNRSELSSAEDEKINLTHNVEKATVAAGNAADRLESVETAMAAAKRLKASVTAGA